jgi:1A family penicillin-binding protein
MGKKRKSSRRKSAAGAAVTRRSLRWRRLALSSGATILGVGILFWMRCGVAGCPDPTALESYTVEGASVLLDRHGREFAVLHPLERRVVPLDSIPDHVSGAFVASEDHRFQRHRGVDWFRMAGAALRNATSGRVVEGGSTITMQLARTAFPEQLPRSDRTLRRKLLEMRVAAEIETRFSKDQILELYLNHVYLGGGAYGVHAAARYYFDRPVADLSLADAALLASVAPAPALFDPRRHPDRARARRDQVLDRMVARGLVSDSAAREAREADPAVVPEPPSPATSAPAPYFVDMVRRELDSIFVRGAPGPGLRIQTTLEPSIQQAAEGELTRILDAVEGGRFGTYRGSRFDPASPGGTGGTDYLQGAVVLMDPGTGQVLALVGGRDFAHSRFNRAVTGRRPPGSAFKPFVYAAALQAGVATSQPISGRPFTLVSEGAPDWSPRNHDGEYQDRAGMRQALVRSLNVPTARLALEVGMPQVVAAARSAGIPGGIPATPAASLGTGSVSPLDLTVAFATLAGLGNRPRARFIQRIEDADGNLLHEAGTELTAVMDPRVAYIVNDMLGDALLRGTGTAALSAGFTGRAAGKTGTTQEAADAWFVGYTSRIVGTVWIGHDRPRSILPGATGGLLAAPVWGGIMARLPDGLSAGGGWARPPGIVERTVDPTSGLVPAPGCRTVDRGNLAPELFLEEFVPATGCPEAGDGGSEGVMSRIASVVRGFFRSEVEAVEEPPEADRLTAPGEGRSGPGSYLGLDRIPLAGESVQRSGDASR